MSNLKLFAATALALSVAGCGSDEGTIDDGGTGDDGYEVLADLDWTLAPGGDHYYCIRKTLDEDLYIGGFRSISPPGVHHILVSAGNAVSEDGVYDCEAGTHNFAQMIYESSSGEDVFQLPDGLAAKVPAGHQINVNLHVLNASDVELSGTVGVEILPRAAVAAESLATIVHMGPVTLELPPGETTVNGKCTMPAGVTAFGILPHMHGLAVHQKVVAHSSADGESILLDEDYDFDRTKKLFKVDPMVQIEEGDVVDVYCSYNNTSNETVYWGSDSYSAEMCSGGVYVFPAGDLASICAY